MKQFVSRIFSPFTRVAGASPVSSALTRPTSAASYAIRQRQFSSAAKILSTETFENKHSISQEDNENTSIASTTDYDYVAGVKIPKIQEANEKYFKTVNAIIKENTLHNVSEIVALANQAERLVPPYTPNPDLAGKLISLYTDHKGKTIPSPVSKEIALKADVIVFLGLDTADTEPGTIVGLRGLSQMLFGTINAKDKTIVSYFPSASRAERYKQGFLQLADERHEDENENAKAFAGEFIMPRFLDEKNRLLPPSQVTPFIIADYSLGAREAALIENACVSFFREANVKPEKIQAYLDRYMRINLGHAVNWQVSSPGHPVSRSFSVLSLSDMGVKKTRSLMNAIYYNASISSQPVSLFHRSIPAREWLVVIGDGQIPPYTVDRHGRHKLNSLAHGMEGYFSTTPLLEKTGILPMTHALLDNNHDTIATLEADLLAKSQRFEPYRIASTIDIEKRKMLWGLYLLNQDELAQKFHAAGKVVEETGTEQCNSDNWQKYIANKRLSSPSKGTKALIS